MLIYKITNTINGKIYIGQTSKSVEQRWREHCLDASRKGPARSAIHAAIRKYGPDKFSIQEVTSCATQEELNLAEVHYIKELQANWAYFGYNLAEGGYRPGHSEATRKRMSASQKLVKHKPHTETTKARMSAAHKGIIFTEEHKAKLSAARKGRTFQPLSAETKAKLSLANKGRKLVRRSNAT